MSSLFAVILLFVSSGSTAGFPMNQSGEFENPTILADSLNVSFQGNWPFGSCFDAEVNSAGTIAFCSMGGGVYTVDVSDPSSPVILSDKIRARGSVVELCYNESADLLLLSVINSGLEIWDVQNSQNPVLLGFFNTTGQNYGIASSGNYVYLGNKSAGLVVIDISDPANPFKAGSLYLSGDLWRLRHSGNLIYAAELYDGLQIIDVADPSSPVAIGSFQNTGSVFDVALAGDYAFLADPTHGLFVLNVSDPSSPYVCGSTSAPCVATGITVDNGLAYVAAGSDGLYIFDLSTISHPALIGSCDSPGSANNVVISTDHAFLCDELGMNIIDITSPASPSLTSSLDAEGFTFSIALHEDIAVSTGTCKGMTILDISDPASPVNLYSNYLFQSSEAVEIFNGFLHVIDYHDGLYVYNLADPTNPVFTGACDPGDMYVDLDISTAGVFALSYSSGLYSIDVSDTGIPQVIAVNPLTGYNPGELTLSDESALISSYRDVLMLDVSDPYNTTLLGSYTSPATQGCRGIALKGDTAYLVAGTGLEIVDFTNPSSPSLVGTWSFPSVATDITLSGSFACVTLENHNLRVLNIASPTSVFEAGFYYSPLNYGETLMREDLIFASAGDNGVQIYSFSNQGIEEENSGNSSILSVSQNPTPGAVSLNFQLELPSEVEISIFNVAGRQVAPSSRNFYSAGQHQFSLNTLPAGLYFAVLKTPSYEAKASFVVVSNN